MATIAFTAHPSCSSPNSITTTKFQPHSFLSSTYCTFSRKVYRKNPSHFTLTSNSPKSPPSPFDLSPPPIDHDPLEFMEISGAEALEETSFEKIADDELAIKVAFHGVAVVDLSHFGRIRVTGEDRIQFLHNQTTAKFDSLTEGEGCDTVFVTPTARTVDVAHAWLMKNAIMLLVSPDTCTNIVRMLNKYIFYSDKVEVHDITQKTCFIVLLGPKSNQVMKTLKIDDLIGQPYGTHRHYNVNGMPITVGVGSVVSKDGFSFLMSTSSLVPVWKALLGCGAIPMGASAWERLRVLQGRPAPGKELTNDFIVLEAGLWEAVSVDKGCYKGQETIARLITYGGVKQRLWAIQLSGPVEAGSNITTDDGRKVGVLTSYSVGKEDGEHVGLGYVRKQVGVGEKIYIGDVVGILVHAPFLSYPSA